MGGRGTEFQATKTISAVVEQRTAGAGGGGGEPETQNQQTTAGGGGGGEERTSRVREQALDWKGQGTVTISDNARGQLNTLMGRDMKDSDIAKLFGIPRGGEVRVGSADRFGKMNVEVIIPGVLMGTAQYTISKGSRNSIIINGELARKEFDSKPTAGAEMVRQLVSGAKAYGVKEITISGAAGVGRMRNSDGSIRSSPRQGADAYWTGFKSWVKYGWDRALTKSEKRDAAANGVNMKGIRTVGQLMANKAGERYWKDYGTAGRYTFKLRSGSQSMKTLNRLLGRLNIRDFGPIT